ncbi:hypothetical protein GGI08_006409, partial [Coemansia sp. S2]
LMREAERRRAFVLAQESNSPCTEPECQAPELGSSRVAHVPRTRSWLAQITVNGLVHPIQALVRSASYSLMWLQGDPAALLWAHMDDYAFPERVSRLTTHPAGRSRQDPTQAKAQPGSLFDIVKSAAKGLPSGIVSVAREFFMDFGIPRAHLDSSVSGYPQVSAPMDTTDFCLAPAASAPRMGVRIYSAATVMPALDPSTLRPTAMQYQQHSSELPHGTKMNRKHTDFAQPNQSYVKGVMDSTPFSYIHPGLYGDLPSLWLPVAHLKRRSENKRSTKQKLVDARRTLAGLLEDNIIGEQTADKIRHRRRRDSTGPTPPLAIAFAESPGEKHEDGDVLRVMEDIHVASECGRLGIDPQLIAQWDPTGLHRCQSTIDTSHVAPSVASSEENPLVSDTATTADEYGVLSDSESDNSDSEASDMSPRVV